MAQKFLSEWDGGSPEEKPTDEDCPHLDDHTREYISSGRHHDGFRERRVYCNACCTVIERERLPLT